MAGPDYTSILTALTGGTDKAIEETNPWSGLESFTSQFGSAITQAAPNYDLQDSLIAGLLTGAIGGLTKNFSNSYKNEQKDYASQAVKDLIEGKSLTRDTYQGNPSVFNVLEQSKNAIDLANTQDALERQRAIQQAKDQYAATTPLEVERQKKLLEAQQEVQRKQFQGTGLEPIANLPTGLQDNAITQEGTRKENQNVANFIDKQFETAKGLSSFTSFIPGTTAANEMTGIQVSLTTALQKALGREMNAKEQERLAAATPDWNDTEGQIELKKQRFLELMGSISKATPLTGVTGAMGPSMGLGDQTENPLSKYTPEQIAYMKSKGML